MEYPKDYINKIICGDCLKIMRDMPDGCVDLVITDPPYGFERFDTDGKDFMDSLIPRMLSMKRVVKRGGYVFVFSGTGKVIELANIVPFEFQRMLWVYKPNDCTFPYKGWLLTSEAILMFRNGKGNNTLRERRPYQHDCYTHKSVGQESVEGHPTVKPLSIIRDLVSRANESDIIFDPFLGSGTTAVAAKQLGRNFIGVEINPEYCRIAEERLKQEVLPFTRPQSEPEKNPDLFEVEK